VIAESDPNHFGRQRRELCVNEPPPTGHRRPDPPVVLLHGQPGNGSDWDAVVGRLPQHLRTLTPDRPGYRTSPYPPGGFRENAKWLLGELDRADVPDAILVGHSFGGGVALDAALLAPERVRALVLVASVGPGCLDAWDTMLAAPMIGPACALAAWSLSPWFARRRLARIARIRGRQLEPHEHVNWAIWGAARHEHGSMWRTFLIEQRELVRAVDELTDRLGQISAPTVVIADPGDRLIPVAASYELSRRIPNASLFLVDEGGHHLPRRLPQVVAEQIERVASAVV
jgi:pimeloyl-ACP methyl ester carboxylesterase